MARPKKTNENRTLATGGGNATAAGVNFQASAASFLAVRGIAGIPLDGRLGLGPASAVALRFETEAPVDDLLVELDSGGWIFVQAKNTLNSSPSLTSELGKTCDEFVRLWELSASGTGKRGWDRPLLSGLDALVIAVGPGTSGKIKNDLAQALEKYCSSSDDTMNGGQKVALKSLRSLLKKAIDARGTKAGSINADDILRLIRILAFDFGGPDRSAAEAWLANALEVPSTAPSAFAVLEKECERRMAARGGITIQGFRAVLSRSGVAVKAPPDYQGDVARLRERSAKVAGTLSDFERTQVSGVDVTIDRACTGASVAAAAGGSFVVLGDPGSGKSAVINETARCLRSLGSEVILLAVDRLQVETLEGLSAELGLSHPLYRVLENWPGVGPAFLVLDALDACRFGKSEALFRTLMQDVLQLDGGRWHLIASIRTFDLLVGQEFATLFRGVPPDASYVDRQFPAVRHIKVPEWSDAEFNDLLSQLPTLGVAVNNGGQKLADLARVPFNTRLLADLLTAGATADDFKDLSSQVELLDLYWNKRVRSIGAAAEQCLRNTVISMIERERMEATRLSAGVNTGDALDKLQRSGVLIAVNGDRDVAFRHHILFDYVASRVLIDLGDIPATQLLLKGSGAGLLLAPALSFALQHLWENSAGGRERFWFVIASLAGGADGGPIARTAAARAACDLPRVEGDVDGLLALILGGSPETAFNAVRHIIGSLAVRLEDEKDSVEIAPWCHLAEELAPVVKEIAWSLRILIGSLLDRVESDGINKTRLGAASRALMGHSFDAQGGGGLMPLAISFVGKTFDTDPAKSRGLVERLLEPRRLADHASSDMHWLAQEVGSIGDTDPDLVVLIYDKVFSHVVTDDSRTQIGQSQILPLLSNKRQDFKMAQWALSEKFSDFARKHPLAAAAAVVRVARAYRATEHPLSEPEETVRINIGGVTAELCPDWSCIWAANHKQEYADNALKIVDAFVDLLCDVPDDDAVALAQCVIAANELAWLWSRLFMVAAQRGGALAAMLWPWATQLAFLKARDTQKDAIDLISSAYGERTDAERNTFETKVGRLTVDGLNPSLLDAATRLQRRVFGAIGVDGLATPEARQIVETAIAQNKIVANDRNHVPGRAEWIESGDFDWLREQGVDTTAAENVPVLEAIRACEASSPEASPSQRTAAAQVLYDCLLKPPASTHPVALSRGWEVLTQTLETITERPETLRSIGAQERSFIEKVIGEVAGSTASQAGPQIGDRSRANLACATMNLARSEAALAARLKPSIILWAKDSSPHVRHDIARRLNYLWNVDRELAWILAQAFGEADKDARVIFGLVDFLVRVVDADPARVGQIAKVIDARNDVASDDSGKELQDAFGALIFLLWVKQGHAGARATIDRWLANRVESKIELGKGAYCLREGLVVGYDKDSAKEDLIRGRCQKLAYEIIDKTANGIESFVGLPETACTNELRTIATNDAELLDRMADQFLFAVGPTEIREGKEPRALTKPVEQQRFIDDNFSTLIRVGDAGLPKTIHYLLQLLDFLMLSNPAAVFDLTSHALLKAGKLHGYQFESLGADLFTKMIGKAIADHRSIFDDLQRRASLVAVLEVFVEAGWPAARRLLYRLPEALR